MRILVTSDWQADYDNLDLCSKAADEILQLKDEHNFSVLVHAGDLKHVYNPVDVRVVNFWLRTIGRWTKNGLMVFVDLGNHDRVGMHVDKQNWLPVLRKAGAWAYDEPTRVGGYPLAFLPFRKDSVILKREAHDLSKQAKSTGTTVLIFHADLKGARYNVLSNSSSDLSVADLCPEKYLFCVGGHLHFQHKVAKNVWYVGSPFATDWGEANQKKGYLLIDTDAGSIKKIRSKIPGWYDPGWPGFEEAKPESWQGAKIRIKAPCDGVQHVKEILEKEKTKADKEYPGADVVVVPEFREGAAKGTGKIKLSFPDEKKIRIYVRETLPVELRVHSKRIEKYLVDQLAQVGGLQREQGELTFRGASARNFLSFKELDIRFEPGLCVVSGQNLDWKGRSNGAGKTSYLQPLAVALFGRTFKEQKHDRWMRTGSKEASVDISFKDSQGRVCLVTRKRPQELKLVVSGEVIESGNRPESTQKLIEQVTGYTWETLANAIYIDQAKSNLMLTGTESERKGFLAKLQNLERFERSLKAVGSQKSDFERRYEWVSERLQSVLTEKSNLLVSISSAKQILAINASVSVSYKRTKRQFLEKKEELRVWEEKAAKQTAQIDAGIRDILATERTISERRGERNASLENLTRRMAKFKRLEGTCPTCEQMIDEKLIAIALPEMERNIKAIEAHLKVYDEQEKKDQKRKEALEEEKDKWRRNQPLAIEVNDLQLKMEKIKIEWQQYEKQQEFLDGLRERVKACKKKIESLTLKKGKLSKWLEVLKYSQSVFQRNGLPAYLNEQICPELNQAAEEYAELFAQSEIQVRFSVDDEGRLDEQVINAHGGETVEDQSEGEMKMASLITSFAVRSVAPKTNLLILDEPGDGLDSTSAKSFARGLKQVVDRFGTVMLCTHNPVILSELADARSVVIKKENRVSEVMA